MHRNVVFKTFEREREDTVVFDSSSSFSNADSAQVKQQSHLAVPLLRLHSFSLWLDTMYGLIDLNTVNDDDGEETPASTTSQALSPFELNRKFDPEDKHHIVRIYDYFLYQRHLCIAFELLDTNLYELIKINHFRGLSLSIVQLFSKQILRGLALMKDAGIIHCDLKPENILLCTRIWIKL